MSNEYFDCIIIGAGAAGLFCAANISLPRQRNILILEKNSSAGKKLLLSGSGHCNITHTGSRGEFLKQYYEGAAFMKHAISAFSNNDMLKFLDKAGVGVKVMDNGKVFPASMDSADVLAALLLAVSKRQALVKYGESAFDVSIEGGLFHVSTKNAVYVSKRVVIAAGGCSYPASGSNGDSYRLISSLGHPVTELTPALAHFIIKDNPFKALAGVSVSSPNCAIMRGGKIIDRGAGDILFTHSGLSGPGVLDISRGVLSGDSFRFALIPMSEDEFINDFILRSRSEGKKNILTLLKSYGVPERLAGCLLEGFSIKADKHASEIAKNERRLIASALCAMTVEIESKGGWKTAMVTSGGASIEHINSKTMESLLVSGLYIAGEALNIDGASGGYNLQAAFSTGFLAARSVAKACDL